MLVEKIGLELADSLKELRARTDISSEAKLRELTDVLVRQRAESPSQFRVLDQSESVVPEPLRTRHREARRVVLSGLIEDGIEAGDFKPVDPRVAAFTVLGMCNWVAWWYYPGPDNEIDVVAAQITQSAVDMLIADTAAGGGVTATRTALAAARASLDTLERLLPSPAYATQLRFLGRQMITRINAKTGKETIRSIRVPPPGGDQTLQTETPRERESAPPVEPGPVRTRETASAGYREALAAFQATKPDSPAKPEGCNLTSTPALTPNAWLGWVPPVAAVERTCVGVAPREDGRYGVVLSVRICAVLELQYARLNRGPGYPFGCGFTCMHAGVGLPSV
jgi:hypothetical protein